VEAVFSIKFIYMYSELSGTNFHAELSSAELSGNQLRHRPSLSKYLQNYWNHILIKGRCSKVTRINYEAIVKKTFDW